MIFVGFEWVEGPFRAFGTGARFGLLRKDGLSAGTTGLRYETLSAAGAFVITIFGLPSSSVTNATDVTTVAVTVRLPSAGDDQTF